MIASDRNRGRNGPGPSQMGGGEAVFTATMQISVQLGKRTLRAVVQQSTALPNPIMETKGTPGQNTGVKSTASNTGGVDSRATIVASRGTFGVESSVDTHLAWWEFSPGISVEVTRPATGLSVGRTRSGCRAVPLRPQPTTRTATGNHDSDRIPRVFGCPTLRGLFVPNCRRNYTNAKC